MFLSFSSYSILQNYINAPRIENLPYSDFKTLLKAKKLDNIRLTETDISGTIILKDIEEFLPFERAESLKKNGEFERSFFTVRLEDPKPH